MTYEKAEKYVRDRSPFQFTYSVDDDEQYAKDVKQAYIDGFKEGTIETENNTLNIGKKVQEENVFLNYYNYYGIALKGNEYPLPLTKDTFFELFIVVPGFFSVVFISFFQLLVI